MSNDDNDHPPLTITRQNNQSTILQALRTLGDDASFVAVGGYVRDRLLGRRVGDLDLATALMPETVIKRARNLGITAIPTGLRHGTATIVLNGENVEITTYRNDGEYLDPLCLATWFQHRAIHGQRDSTKAGRGIKSGR